MVWYGAVHVDPRQVGEVQRALFNSYPTITVINIADVIETIQAVVQQITVVVRFLAAFSILSGAVILASSIASTHFRRVREVVVLKTLGAQAKPHRRCVQRGVYCAGTAGRAGGSNLCQPALPGIAASPGCGVSHGVAGDRRLRWQERRYSQR